MIDAWGSPGWSHRGDGRSAACSPGCTATTAVGRRLVHHHGHELPRRAQPAPELRRLVLEHRRHAGPISNYNGTAVCSGPRTRRTCWRRPTDRGYHRRMTTPDDDRRGLGRVFGAWPGSRALALDRLGPTTGGSAASPRQSRYAGAAEARVLRRGAPHLPGRPTLERRAGPVHGAGSDTAVACGPPQQLLWAATPTDRAPSDSGGRGATARRSRYESVCTASTSRRFATRGCATYSVFRSRPDRRSRRGKPALTEIRNTTVRCSEPAISFVRRHTEHTRCESRQFPTRTHLSVRWRDV